ncbi:MAG: hypothetical protein ACLURV_03375 [Gallintestinimicrobium sp.]
MTAQEVGALSEKVDRLADAFLQHVDLEQVLRIAATADSVSETIKSEAALKSPDCPDFPQFPAPDKGCLRIGIAQDTAFCFYYEENKRALRQQGLELVEFSPMEDKKLPEGICGLYLGGGYPELHAGKLSENSGMRHAILRRSVMGCRRLRVGGFLYLQKELEDAEGQVWEMTGVLDGSGFRTNRLQRFGYAVMTAKKIPCCLKKGKHSVHEFHYWDCTQNRTAFEMKSRSETKPGRKRSRKQSVCRLSAFIFSGRAKAGRTVCQGGGRWQEKQREKAL